MRMPHTVHHQASPAESIAVAYQPCEVASSDACAKISAAWGGVFGRWAEVDAWVETLERNRGVVYGLPDPRSPAGDENAELLYRTLWGVSEIIIDISGTLLSF